MLQRYPGEEAFSSSLSSFLEFTVSSSSISYPSFITHNLAPHYNHSKDLTDLWGILTRKWRFCEKIESYPVRPRVKANLHTRQVWLSLSSSAWSIDFTLYTMYCFNEFVLQGAFVGVVTGKSSGDTTPPTRDT
ncbi:unnamed protein product [Prunus armeniaca]